MKFVRIQRMLRFSESSIFNQLTIAQVQEQLPKMATQLNLEPTVIMQDGQPVMITFSVEHFLSCLETAEILADSDLMRSLKSGISQANRKEYFDLADVKAELEL